MAGDSITRMSISELTPGASPAQTAGRRPGLVREVAETLWSARTDDDLVDTVGLVAQLSSVLAAVEAGAVAEVDTRDLATQTGCGTGRPGTGSPTPPGYAAAKADTGWSAPKPSPDP